MGRRVAKSAYCRAESLIKYETRLCAKAAEACLIYMPRVEQPGYPRPEK